MSEKVEKEGVKEVEITIKGVIVVLILSIAEYEF